MNKAIDRILGAYYKIHDWLRIPSVIAGLILVTITIAHTHNNPHGTQWIPGIIGLALCFWGLHFGGL